MKPFFKSVVAAILTFEAKIILKRKKPTVIAITGSVGKTSTKDAVYAAIKSSVSARKTQKNFNSEIGIPLTILGLQTAWSNPFAWLSNLVEGLAICLFSNDYPEVLVLETGVDRPGDMKRLASWLKPDMVVITRLPDVPVHVEYFSSPEDVVTEKMYLVKALKSDGILIYNHDDEKIRNLVSDVRQTAFGFSRYSPSHFHISNDKVVYDGSTPTGLEFSLTHIDETATVKIKESLGVQHAYNCAAAVAVATQFDISLTESTSALSAHVPPAGRMRIIDGTQGSVIIDDTYNSSPVATRQALQTLSEVTHVKRKILVLGDMLELGKFSVREHEWVGELAAEFADILVTVGLRSRKIAESALEHGMSEKVIFQYDDVNRAGNELKSMVTTGDIILVKASQSIRAEKVVKILMDKPEHAVDLLARQNQEWLVK